MSQHVVVVAHLAVEFGGNLGVGFEVHQDVVAFFVSLDFVSEFSLVPLGRALNGSAVVFHNSLKLVGYLLNHGVGVRARNNVKSFVLSHELLYGLNGSIDGAEGHQDT